MANSLKGRKRVNLDGQPHEHFLLRRFPKSQFLTFIWGLVFGYFLAWYKFNDFLAKKSSLTLGTVISKYFAILFVCPQVLSEEETKL